MTYSRENLPPTTPWFNSRTKPMHIGVYKVRFSTSRYREGYAYWDGVRWAQSADTSRGALHCKRDGGVQSKEWCGLQEHVA